jgi:ferrous iron transport protein B
MSLTDAQCDPTVSRTAPAVVAMVGNPNTGKTTLFNELTGYRQRVGNYPGVTVEKVTGALRGASRAVELIDLPGTYSLAARSADEMVVVDVLLGQEIGVPRPDLIVAIVDASNLRRNLYLTSQLLELGLPVVVTLNMVDLAKRFGQHIDIPALSAGLGVPVVPVVANRGEGLDALRDQIVASLDVSPPERRPMLPEVVLSAMDSLNGDFQSPPPQLEMLHVLIDEGGFAEQRFVRERDRNAAARLNEHRRRLVDAGIVLARVEADSRYRWIDSILDGVVRTADDAHAGWTDRIDGVLTHRVWGMLFFMVVMAAVFQSIYTWTGPFMDATESLFAWAGDGLGRLLPAGAFRSLVVNGIVAGVGAVMVFLPQILVLFLFLAILEDCGYMARAALLMDRVMSAFGLSGRSFIPLLSSFACAIPGIMATRTIEDRRDRIVTILIAPLMSCSARLPVYTLLIGAFVPATHYLGGWFGLQGLVLLAMYLVGIVVAVPVAWLLRQTVFRGPTDGFMMELPTYKWPSIRTVLYRMYDRGKAFVVRAGTIIFAVTIVVWGLAYYPRPASIHADFETRRIAIADDTEAAAHLDREEAGTYLRQSVLGRMGRAVEPAVKPLGWDWRIGMAAIASFPAREVIIGTLGTIFNLGQDIDADSVEMHGTLTSATWADDGRPLFNLAVALSVMVFFALCCQCGATLAIIRRETGTWRWPIFTFTYMTVLAYLGALATYQIAVRWI